MKPSFHGTIASAVFCAALASSACTKASSSKPEAVATPEANAAAPAGVVLCEHGVPKDECTKCAPDLAATFQELGDWCEIHGLPKSHDKLCDPSLTFGAVVVKDWCEEHAVPESKCTKCKPALIASFIEAGDYCREHGYAESVCPYCHPELVRQAGEEMPVFPVPGTKIRLASADTAREAGIQTVDAEVTPHAATVEATGEIGFDLNRLARLAARTESSVVSVKVDVGDDVRAGQALVVVASGAVGEEQSRLAAARARVAGATAALEREEELHRKRVSALRDVEAARTELAAAKAEEDAAHSSLGAAGAGSSTSGGRYTLVAPFAGTVVLRDAVAGQSVAAGRVLIEVADLSTMWATLAVPEDSASRVKPGQPVLLFIGAENAAPVEARITRVAASIDPRTRTVSVRVALPNGDRALKSGRFVRAKIQVTDKRDAILLPSEAVQRAEGQALVFVRTGEGTYDPRAVELGETDGAMVEVRKGVASGEKVVTTGAFLLKTEILKDSIGAGCCEVDEK